MLPLLVMTRASPSSQEASLLHHEQPCRAKKQAVAFVLVGRVPGVTSPQTLSDRRERSAARPGWRPVPAPRRASPGRLSLRPLPGSTGQHPTPLPAPRDRPAKPLCARRLWLRLPGAHTARDRRGEGAEPAVFPAETAAGSGDNRRQEVSPGPRERGAAARGRPAHWGRVPERPTRPPGGVSPRTHPAHWERVPEGRPAHLEACPLDPAPRTAVTSGAAPAAGTESPPALRSLVSSAESRRHDHAPREPQRGRPAGQPPRRACCPPARPPAALGRRAGPRPVGPAGLDGADGVHGRRGSRGLGCGARHGQRPDRSLQRGELGASPAGRSAGPSPCRLPAPGALRLRDPAVPGLLHHAEGPDPVRGLQRGPEAVQVQPRSELLALKRPGATVVRIGADPGPALHSTPPLHRQPDQTARMYPPSRASPPHR